MLDRADYHYVLRDGSTTRSNFGLKDYKSLVAYKSAVQICKNNYPNLLPYAQYYELNELYEAQAKLADSGGYVELWRFAFRLRVRIAVSIMNCIKWRQIRCKYGREILIYALSVLLGYRLTYQLMMLKQRVKDESFE